MANSANSERIMKKSGNFNIAPHKKAFQFGDLYHSFMVMKRYELIFFMVVTYLVINLFFGTLYFLAGPEALEGVRTDHFFHQLLDSFFFSVQTFATIGYGKITPATTTANIIVTLEALVGLLTVAFFTGMIFARFSKPSSKIIFSSVALITKHNGEKQLIFRMSNGRMNRIVEARAIVTLAIDETSKEGERHRKLYELTLERNMSPIFTLSWTVRHTLNESSPICLLDLAELKKGRAEILVIVTGLDDSYGQQVHARTAYSYEEIIPNAKFVDIISRDENGRVQISHDKIHDYIKV
ncbi:MAG: ion channel [Bacteriovoracaceae bacterium]